MWWWSGRANDGRGLATGDGESGTVELGVRVTGGNATRDSSGTEEVTEDLLDTSGGRVVRNWTSKG